MYPGQCYSAGREIAGGGTEWLVLGPFGLGEVLRRVELVLSATIAGGTLVGASLGGVGEGSQATLNAGRPVLRFSDVVYGTTPVQNVLTMANQLSRLDLWCGYPIGPGAQWLVVYIKDGRASGWLEVVVSAELVREPSWAGAAVAAAAAAE